MLSLVLVDRARLNRGSETSGEAILWRALRGGQLGVVFRRQQPLLAGSSVTLRRRRAWWSKWMVNITLGVTLRMRGAIGRS
jgi:hypothetical protein